MTQPLHTIEQQAQPPADRIVLTPEAIGTEALLIFLHIGKAGGTTFHSILEQQYPRSRHFLSHGAREIEKFKQLAPEEREQTGVFRGHTNYGLHRLVKKPCLYLTMLRDPVERVLSHYYFVRRDPAHFLHEECVRTKMSLREFLFKTTDNDNGQTRALAGVGDIYGFLAPDVVPVPFGQCTPGLLEQAKENLRSCLIAGLVERFDETIILLKRLLNWEEPPFYVKQNVTRDRPQRAAVPEETLELVEQYNRLDRELYRYAEELFEEQIRQQDAYFGAEVRYFQMLNEARGARSDGEQ